jgi:hypothetical protein
MKPDERSQSDEQFLADCRVETYRGPGPGGQKRNKTSSAVRITHQPTGLIATAAELRSQAQNRAMALRRLRLRVAIELRHPIDPVTFTPPEWFTTNIAERNPNYIQVVGLVLDTLAACEWATAPAKTLLGVNSSQFTKFLHADSAVWTMVQKERAARGLRALSHD